MPTLVITRSYNDGVVLTESQLDDLNDSIETFLNVTKIDDENLQDFGVTTTKIATSAITNAKLATDSVSTNKIQDSAVTTAKLDDDSVTGDKIDASVVDDASLEQTGTTLNIKDGGVTTSKILDGAVTNAKRPSLSANLSAGGTDSTSSTTFVDATNVGTVTITTTGRPVFVGLQAENPAGGGGIFRPTFPNAINNEWGAAFQLSRAGVVVQNTNHIVGLSTDTNPVSGGDTQRWNAGGQRNQVGVGLVWVIDSPPAGTHTYKLQFRGFFGETIQIVSAHIVAVEM